MTDEVPISELHENARRLQALLLETMREEIEGLKVKLRESEENEFRLRHAIVTFLDRPGCNPNQRRLQMRRLRWAARIEEEPDDER